MCLFAGRNLYFHYPHKESKPDCCCHCSQRFRPVLMLLFVLLHVDNVSLLVVLVVFFKSGPNVYSLGFLSSLVLLVLFLFLLSFFFVEKEIRGNAREVEMSFCLCCCTNTLPAPVVLVNI